MNTVLTLVSVSSKMEDFMLPCLTKQLIGLDCPGCGIQRSFVFLLRGEFSASWDMYPAIFTLIPLLLMLTLNYFFSIKFANKIIILLTFLSVALILLNFILKLF